MEAAAEKPVVTLFVTHSNLTSMSAETRFQRTLTVGKVKDKIYMTTGTAPDFQALTLQDSAGTPLAILDDDSKQLGFYSPADGMTLHVVDSDPASLSKDGGLEDTSEVEKFKLDSAKYEAKGGSDFRKFRAAKSKRLGKGAPIDDTFQAEEAKELTVGSRCEMPKTGRRGTIRYVGLIPEIKKGFFVGVELDEPTGKNDGSVKGTRYFEVAPNMGAIVRPKAVRQGDFPPIDILDEDDDEI